MPLDLEQRFSRMAAHLPGFVFTFRFSPDGRFSFPYASSGIRDLYGLQPEQVADDIGPLHAMAHPDDREMIEVALANAVKDPGLFHIEFRIIHPEKGIRWLEAKSASAPESDGGIEWHGIMLDITERKRIEQALQSSRVALEEAQRIGHIGSWDVDIVNDVLTWSDETFRIWEIDKTKFAATFEAFIDTVHPEDRERVVQVYNASILDGTRYEVEHRLLFPDGRVKYILERGQPYYDAEGKPLRFIGTSLDITERKHIENTLQFIAQRGWQVDGESFLTVLARYLGRTLAMDYVIIDRLINPAVAETVAIYAKGDVLPNLQYGLSGTPCANVMEGALCCYTERIRQMFPKDILLEEMGVESYVGLPLLDSSGRVLGLIAVMDGKPMSDTTEVTSLLQMVATRAAAELERELSERLLNESRQFLDRVIETIADPVFVKDKQHRWVRLNQAFCDFIGQPMEALLGQCDYDYFPAREAAIFGATDEAVFASGEENVSEETFSDREGITRTIIIKKTRCIDERGQQFLVGTILDITERKQREEELARLHYAIDHVEEAVYLIDADARIQYVNAHACQGLGYSRDELLGLSIPDIDPDYQHAVWPDHWRDLQANGSLTFETRHNTKDGRIFPVEVVANYFESDGQGYNMAMIRNISERKQMELALAEREQEFRTLVENLPTYVLRLNRALRHTYVNPAFVAAVGLPEAEILGAHVSAFWRATNVSINAYITLLKRVLSSGAREDISLEWSNENGALYSHLVRISPEYSTSGEVRGLLVLGFDMTKLRREQLLDVERRHVFERMAQGGDLDEILSQIALYVESAFPGCRCRIQLMDQTGSRLIHDVAPSISVPCPAHQQAVTVDEVGNGCAVSFCRSEPLIMKDMRLATVSEHCRSFALTSGMVSSWSDPIIGSSGQQLGVVTLYRSQAGEPDELNMGRLRYASHLSAIAIERKRIEEQMQHQASYDILTGLPNRRMFRDRLNEEIGKAKRCGESLALLFIDLDRFKEVNDSLGHEIGDLLLVETAQRIRARIRETDTVARLGGDEFIVILPRVDDMSHLGRIAQNIVDDMNKPFSLDIHTVYVSTSIGIAAYPFDTVNADGLIGCADQAMYAVKEHGRNGFGFFTPAMQQQAQTRLLLANDLRDALVKGQLQVHYQPIVDVASGEIVKAEALLRWLHPQRGWVPPDQFISIAEENGLIHDIGDWVFRQAVGTARLWNADARVARQISVNLSPRQFIKGDFYASWLAYLEQSGVAPEHIVIEITEGLLLDDRPDILQTINRLGNLGMQVALDDFGTGYSAMGYLKKFPIDYLKIDRSFVRDLESDSNDRAIAEAIVVMAHKLGLKTIAEGVETVGQRDLLASVGCEFVQGYLYAKPMPERELLAFALETAPFS
ncbi:diguanylate cyclase/phosphodiesterase with PAS/PAC and GAF sensor(s) [Methylomonas methanica MC09]|uniref:Diguanylate cyclase/phosphodiesterase with PAS/PAC and GAF sensor(S) n=2 Tax=Methylomonas methanica TaxID=421 RepID=F9ZXT5_METMM|nr:diguanylate cyclase/phosphodiesterase with PAS/PAC and GAF sensor(s) [Methylomonas methanica MC09]